MAAGHAGDALRLYQRRNWTLSDRLRPHSAGAAAAKAEALPGPDAKPDNRRGYELGAARLWPTKDCGEDDRTDKVARYGDCPYLQIAAGLPPANVAY